MVQNSLPPPPPASAEASKAPAPLAWTGGGGVMGWLRVRGWIRDPGKEALRAARAGESPMGIPPILFAALALDWDLLDRLNAEGASLAEAIDWDEFFRDSERGMSLIEGASMLGGHARGSGMRLFNGWGLSATFSWTSWVRSWREWLSEQDDFRSADLKRRWRVDVHARRTRPWRITQARRLMRPWRQSWRAHLWERCDPATALLLREDDVDPASHAARLRRAMEGGWGPELSSWARSDVEGALLPAMMWPTCEGIDWVAAQGGSLAGHPLAFRWATSLFATADDVEGWELRVALGVEKIRRMASMGLFELDPAQVAAHAFPAGFLNAMPGLALRAMLDLDFSMAPGVRSAIQAQAEEAARVVRSSPPECGQDFGGGESKTYAQLFEIGLGMLAAVQAKELAVGLGAPSALGGSGPWGRGARRM